MGITEVALIKEKTYRKVLENNQKCETCRRCRSLTSYGLDLNPWCGANHDEFMDSEYCPYKLE